MAKGKERPTVEPKSGARSPGARPMQPQGPAKQVPPAARPVERQASDSRTKLSPEEVYKLIQESAYFKAKARGFAPGHEVQDWVEAEAEVRRRLEGRGP
jgi:Protein of unknown function (DUF2934)